MLRASATTRQQDAAEMAVLAAKEADGSLSVIAVTFITTPPVVWCLMIRPTHKTSLPRNIVRNTPQERQRFCRIDDLNAAFQLDLGGKGTTIDIRRCSVGPMNWLL